MNRSDQNCLTRLELNWKPPELSAPTAGNGFGLLRPDLVGLGGGFSILKPDFDRLTDHLLRRVAILQIQWDLARSSETLSDLVRFRQILTRSLLSPPWCHCLLKPTANRPAQSNHLCGWLAIWIFANLFSFLKQLDFFFFSSLFSVKLENAKVRLCDIVFFLGLD